MDNLMELIPMSVQVISKSFVYLLLFAGISFAQRDSSLALEDTITAKYCLHADTRINFSKNNENIWILSVYEQIIPFTFTIQTRLYKFSLIGKAELISGISDLKSEKKIIKGFRCGGSSSANKKEYRCIMGQKDQYYIYDDLFFSYDFSDSTKIRALFGKTLPLEWNLNFSIDRQKQTLSGTHYVYISGFCNKEQMAQIREINKEREKAMQKPKVRWIK